MKLKLIISDRELFLSFIFYRYWYRYRYRYCLLIPVLIDTIWCKKIWCELWVIFLFVFYFINITWIIHPKMKIVSLLYSLSSCFKPECVFITSFEHKRYFEEWGKSNSCWSPVTSIVFFATIKFIVDQQLFGYILQNIFFCVQHKKEINTGLGQHVSE